MALASFGEPAYLDEFREIIQLGEDGQYTIQTPRPGGTLWPAAPERRAARAAALSTSPIRCRSRWKRRCCRLPSGCTHETGSDNLCMAGGVALNCVMNARLRDHGPFKNIWVQPAAGDAGTALGAALWIDAAASARPDEPQLPHGPRLPGPEHTATTRSRSSCSWSKLPYRRVEDVAEEAAELLAQDKIIGWFQGRHGVWAARAGRALDPGLADPRRDAGALERHQGPRRFPPGGAGGAGRGGGRLVQGRRVLALHAVRVRRAARQGRPHPGGASRGRHGPHPDHQPRRRTRAYYDLLKAFQQRPACRCWSTRPSTHAASRLSCSPRDAVECFWTSPLDALVIGPFLLEKPVQAAHAGSEQHDVRSRSSSRPTSAPSCWTRCLLALLSQDFDPSAYEIIVVDDGADEATRQRGGRSAADESRPTLPGAANRLRQPRLAPRGTGTSWLEQPRRRSRRAAGADQRGGACPALALPGDPRDTTARRLPATWAGGRRGAQIIAFTDDDCLPQPRLARPGVRAMQAGA